MKFEKIRYEQFEKDFLMNNGQCACKYDDIKLPKRATKFSAGYDFFAPYSITMYPGDTVDIPTGIKVNLDEDKFLMIVPRSGIGFKYGIHLVNTVGIIDSDYYYSKNDGHIRVKLYYPKGVVYPEFTFRLSAGEAMCQGIILPYYKISDDNTEDIRTGGFGSTSEIK